MLNESLNVTAAKLGVTHVSMPEAMLKDGIRADDVILELEGCPTGTGGDIRVLAAELLADAISDRER